MIHFCGHNRRQVQDVEGVELCGTLKNVVAIAAGIEHTPNSFSVCFVPSRRRVKIQNGDFAGLVDGLDMGNNTKVCNSFVRTIT